MCSKLILKCIPQLLSLVFSNFIFPRYFFTIKNLFFPRYTRYDVIIYQNNFWSILSKQHESEETIFLKYANINHVTFNSLLIKINFTESIMLNSFLVTTKQNTLMEIENIIIATLIMMSCNISLALIFDSIYCNLVKTI